MKRHVKVTFEFTQVHVELADETVAGAFARAVMSLPEPVSNLIERISIEEIDEL